MFTEMWLVAIVSLILGSLGAAFLYLFGRKMRLIDTPNQRSSHRVATPIAGGIGLWVACALAGLFIFKNYSFAIIAAGVGLLGLSIDLFDFSPRVRLLVEFIASFAALVSLSVLPCSLSAIPIFFLWAAFVVATANIYNFMDGIDGMAALTGMVGFGLLALFSSAGSTDGTVKPISVVLALSCLGFLPFNFPKARVFMGDTGSLFLGFVFAIFVARLSSGFREVLCLGMFMSMFYADAAATIFCRLRKREDLIEAHRSHLYQYLSNQLAFPHWQVSLSYAFIQLMVGLLSLLAYKAGIVYQFLLFAVFTIIFLLAYYSIKARRPAGITG